MRGRGNYRNLLSHIVQDPSNSLKSFATRECMGINVRLALSNASSTHKDKILVITYFMNATMGLMRALFVYDRSAVNKGTAALRSLNLKSISMTTLGFSVLSVCTTVLSEGALNGGFASSRCPGIRSMTADVAAVVMASAISPMSTFKVDSSGRSRGNLMSITASTFPEVIQEKGPSSVVIACR